MATASPKRSIRFTTFPTPSTLSMKNSVIATLDIKPLLVFAKARESVKRRDMKASAKKSVTEPVVCGSTK